MARLTFSGVVAAAMIGGLIMSAPASAMTYDKLAYMTFSAPVQIPGVTLDAGTYRFRLANPDTSRNVIQVLSRDGAMVYAMFHTIPDNRASLTDDPTVTFKETPAGVPPAVKSLFYGGEYHGYEFVYGKGEPRMIVESAPQPEITYTRAPAAVPAEPIAEGVGEPEPLIEPEPVAQSEVAAAPAVLPRTASPLPLVALGGLMSVLTGLGMGVLRRRR